MEVVQCDIGITSWRDNMQRVGGYLVTWGIPYSKVER